MSTKRTQQTLERYTALLMQRGPYGQYFSDDCTFTLMGAGQIFSGPAAVEGFVRRLHEQAFDAQPEVVNLLIGDEQAVVEAIFRGTHTGEFLGVRATGRSVAVPYVVFYQIRGDKLTALRGYLPLEVLIGQLTAPEPARPPKKVWPAGSGHPRSQPV